MEKIIYQPFLFKDWRGERGSTSGWGLIYSDETAHTIRIERHLGKFVQSFNCISLSRPNISTMQILKARCDLDDNYPTL